jgi:hypothetical protein
VRVTFRLVVAAFALIFIITVFALVFSSLQGVLSPANHLTLTQSDAGHTFRVSSGTSVQLSLKDSFPVPGSSLVWSVASSDPSVLHLDSASSISVQPGRGDVPYTSTFSTHSPGLVTLSAHGATTCEALAKSACPDQDFSIAIVVT